MKFIVRALFIVCLLAAMPAHAVEVKEVKSHSGVTAWLVEDHHLPLVAMQFAWRGGIEEDPNGKEGLAELTMDLLTEGADGMNANAFQQQLADNSVFMRFSAGRDQLEGSIKSLSKDKDIAFNLLRAAVTKPRFDRDEVERLRGQQLAQLRVQLGNPQWQARYALFQKIFGDHPYSKRRLGTEQTITGLTRADIKNFAQTHMARDNLIVAVAGDISPKELSAALDHVFGILPRNAKLAQIGEVVWPQNTATILLPREGTQTELLFAMPGPKRDDPDWYAAEIADYILGGGGFSSRLMQDVRDKKGLTYGIDTGLSPMEHGAVFMGEAATDNPKTAQAWDIAMDTMHRFYQDGATEKEIQSAKDYL
ncbi:MAG TPA: pitrilysin family protein, partial [Alphaproteobacteria bacterium]|nr:pitrilysin family protein [Alphaproteobacteria bacterium]